MSQTTSTIDRYIDMWNEPDLAKRSALIASAWTADGRYVDPQSDARGYDQLSAVVDGLHTQFPGHRIERTTGVDEHHDQVRFGWILAGPNGAAVVEGLDIGVLAADGRLSSITGFFGGLAAQEAAA
jgi:hypothetical protein